jgi:hypothetical protein
MILIFDNSSMNLKFPKKMKASEGYTAQRDKVTQTTTNGSKKD